MEKLNGYYYKPRASYWRFDTDKPTYDGKYWEWKNCKKLYLTEEGAEQWKTYFFEIEGLDKGSGYPVRKTLDDLGMKKVADLLKSKDKFG